MEGHGIHISKGLQAPNGLWNQSHTTIQVQKYGQMLAFPIISWLPPSFPQWLHHTNTHYRKECDSVSSTQGENLENLLRALCFWSLSASFCTLSASTTACWQHSHFKSILSYPYLWATGALCSWELLLCESPLPEALWCSVFNQSPNFLPPVLIRDSKTAQDSQLPFWLLRGVISSTAEKSNKPHQPQCDDTAFTQL